jgi:hypothetical protein
MVGILNAAFDLASVQSRLKSPHDFFLAIVRAWWKVRQLKFGERSTLFLEDILAFSDSLYIELSKNTTPMSIGLVMAEN